MPQIIPNFQMIHIASELVALVGVTFYFTSKHNSLVSEINKLKSIVQQQQTKISQYDQKFKDIDKQLQSLKTQIAQRPPPQQFRPEDHFQPPMFEDPSDVLAQMMGGTPIFPGGLPPRPPKSSTPEHNIHIVGTGPPDNTKPPLSTNNSVDSIVSDAAETDSQLDLALADELAELSSSESEGRQQKLPNKHDKLSMPTKPVSNDGEQNNKNNLNDGRQSTNSVLSIQDDGQ